MLTHATTCSSRNEMGGSVVLENRMGLITWRRVVTKIVRETGENYFCVIYCAEHCVYIEPGTPNLYLGGATTVGSTTEENFFYKSTMFTSLHYIHEVRINFLKKGVVAWQFMVGYMAQAHNIMRGNWW